MEQKDNSGVLFISNKLSEKHPDYTGLIYLNGAKYNIAGWTNKSKKNTTYISLKVNPVANSTVDEFPPNDISPHEDIF